MELADFVRLALADITFAVHAAKADARELAAIVPGSLNGESLTEETYIEFDIAVSTSAERHNKVGALDEAVQVLT